MQLVEPHQKLFINFQAISDPIVIMLNFEHGVLALGSEEVGHGHMTEAMNVIICQECNSDSFVHARNVNKRGLLNSQLCNEKMQFIRDLIYTQLVQLYLKDTQTNFCKLTQITSNLTLTLTKGGPTLNPRDQRRSTPLCHNYVLIRSCDTLASSLYRVQYTLWYYHLNNFLQPALVHPSRSKISELDAVFNQVQPPLTF